MTTDELTTLLRAVVLSTTDYTKLALNNDRTWKAAMTKQRRALVELIEAILPDTPALTSQAMVDRIIDG